MDADELRDVTTRTTGVTKAARGALPADARKSSWIIVAARTPRRMEAPTIPATWTVRMPPRVAGRRA